MLKEVYLVGANRTALGGFCGAFQEVSAPNLAAACIRATLQRAGIDPGAIDEVIFGNVLGAGVGQNPGARPCSTPS